MIKYRKIAKVIEKWLREKEIIILTGVRQVGKTSLLELLQSKLLTENINPRSVIYLSLENFNILGELNENPENIFKYAEGINERCYFFIDEIQYLDNPSNFLKLLYDKYGEKIKLIVTGSSSLELKANFQDSLVGRKVTFEILPLDFEEFLQFQAFSDIEYLTRADVPLDIMKKFDHALEEFLIYGGMPAVVMQQDREKKTILLGEYINTYINKDVRAIGKIDNIATFNNFIKIMASQIGNLLNVSELSNTLNLDRRTLVKYLDLLEQTFVMYKISPYLGNVRSQITKMQKIYYFDSGIRNAIMNNFSALKDRTDAGALFENFVYMEYKKIIKEQVFFYRTTGGAEIDFVFEGQNNIFAVEVKYKALKKQIDERVLENFDAKIKKQIQRIVINLSLNKNQGLVHYGDYRFIQSHK